MAIAIISLLHMITIIKKQQVKIKSLGFVLMRENNCLRGLSETKSGMKTKKVNVFDRTRRQIRCIEKTHDYLGNGNPITEEDLEIGKLYTFIEGSAESYGNMVYLEEIPSKYGYQSYLFEELFEYDEAILLNEQRNWLMNELHKSREDIKYGRTLPAECISAAMELNKNTGEDIKDEGFVVVDSQHRRVKIKSSAYIALHSAVTNKVFTVRRMIEFFLQGTDFAKLAKDFPNEAHIIKYYDWQFEEVRHNINEMARYTRALYEEYDHDRRAVASEIKDSPYAWAGFAAIDNDKPVEELKKTLSPSKLEKLITEYCFDKDVCAYVKSKKNIG